MWVAERWLQRYRSSEPKWYKSQDIQVLESSDFETELLNHDFITFAPDSFLLKAIELYPQKILISKIMWEDILSIRPIEIILKCKDIVNVWNYSLEILSTERNIEKFNKHAKTLYENGCPVTVLTFYRIAGSHLTDETLFKYFLDKVEPKLVAQAIAIGGREYLTLLECIVEYFSKDDPATLQERMKNRLLTIIEKANVYLYHFLDYIEEEKPTPNAEDMSEFVDIVEKVTSSYSFTASSGHRRRTKKQKLQNPPKRVDLETQLKLIQSEDKLSRLKPLAEAESLLLEFLEKHNVEAGSSSMGAIYNAPE